MTGGGRTSLKQQKGEQEEDANLANTWAMEFASLLTQQKEQEAKQSAKTFESKHIELIFQITSSAEPDKASTQILASLSTMIIW